MKILHTSDWHLGKRLIERERLPEQVEALDEIAAICEEKDVDLVLVAGDVFDTFMPPAEAEELFYHAVKKIAGARRAVVIISGNHDDAVRLTASAPIASEEGIYLFGGKGQRFHTYGDRPVHAVEAGENYVIIENEVGERVYINALPYPNEARLREEKSEESYTEKMLRWIATGDEHYDGKMPHILLSHLFVSGGSVSESERDITLGGARAVPAGGLPNFGYTALGHLHKKQRFGSRIYYSGSLLQYSFDESAEKGVILLETTAEGDVVVAEEIPLKSGKKLIRLEANGVEDAMKILRMHEGCFVELKLHLKEPLTTAETSALHEANSGLISLNTQVEQGMNAEVVHRSELSEEELFTEYYRSVYGEDPSQELKETFLLLLGGEL